MRVQGWRLRDLRDDDVGAYRQLGLVPLNSNILNVGPRRGVRYWNSLLYLSCLVYLLHKNRPAHAELLIPYGEVKSSSEQSGRRLCD